MELNFTPEVSCCQQANVSYRPFMNCAIDRLVCGSEDGRYYLITVIAIFEHCYLASRKNILPIIILM